MKCANSRPVAAFETVLDVRRKDHEVGCFDKSDDNVLELSR